MSNSSIILSSNQTHRLHHTFYHPQSEIKATLLIVHGMAEHSGRYHEFAQFLADNGILVATYDQLGHGLTARHKNELGFFDEKHPIQTLCKDVVIMADKLKTLSPDVPHFIMGHSMGSFIVRVVLTHHASRFAGTVLMGTTDSVSLLGKLMTPALMLLNRFYPKIKNERLATLTNHHLLSQLHSPISASPFAWLSENTEEIKEFEADDLCGFALTNNGFATLNSLIVKACDDGWFAYLPERFSILLVSGKDDPVGAMGADIIQLQEKLIHHTDANIQVCLYPNMRHEPLHEIDKLGVFDDILKWLNKQIDAGKN